MFFCVRSYQCRNASRRQLVLLFDDLNTRYFAGKLPRPIIEISPFPSQLDTDGNIVLAYYRPIHHMIWFRLQAFSRPARTPESILYHEMCHILAPNHGRKFKKLLNRYDCLPELESVFCQNNANYAI